MHVLAGIRGAPPSHVPLNLPTPILVSYLDTPAQASEFLRGIADVDTLALDTEGASFHRFIDRVYLLQLSTRDQHAIVDPLGAGILPEIGLLMERPETEIVFHDADYDLRLLRQDYGWKVTNVFDTRIASQLLGIKAFGLAALLEQYFGVKLDKKHQRADWSMRPLTAGMLDYAAQDTRYLLELRDILHGRLESAGRLAWAREEFLRLENAQFAPDDPGGVFLRIKGARDLNRRELAVLRELVPWRDDLARAADRATFRVMGNDVLLEIARRQPLTAADLGAIKGVPRHLLDSRWTEIADLVNRGLAVQENDLPRFPRAPRWDRDPDFDDRVARLKCVRDDVAAGLDLDPGVLCSRERLEAIARRKPASMSELLEVPDLRRWQAGLMGDGFIAALTARSAAPAPLELALTGETATDTDATPDVTAGAPHASPVLDQPSVALELPLASPPKQPRARGSRPARSKPAVNEESPYRDG